MSIVHTCAHCGDPFEAPHRRGRPPKACSDACRRAIGRAWDKANRKRPAAPRVGVCAICSKKFTAPHATGRRPATCGRAKCKAAFKVRLKARYRISDRPVDHPDLFDNLGASDG